MGSDIWSQEECPAAIQRKRFMELLWQWKIRMFASAVGLLEISQTVSHVVLVSPGRAHDSMEVLIACPNYWSWMFLTQILFCLFFFRPNGNQICQCGSSCHQIRQHWAVLSYVQERHTLWIGAYTVHHIFLAVDNRALKNYQSRIHPNMFDLGKIHLLDSPEEGQRGINQGCTPGLELMMPAAWLGLFYCQNR